MEEDVDRSVIGPPGASQPVNRSRERESVSPAPHAGSAKALKQWAAARSAGDGGIESKIAALPPGVTPGTVQNPVPRVMTRQQYVAAVKGAGIPKRLNKVKPTSVPLDSLSAFQGTVNAERVAQYAHDPGMVPKGKRAVHTGQLVDTPVIVKLGGRSIIHDGNHRVAAAKMRGETSIKARVVDLDAEGFGR